MDFDAAVPPGGPEAKLYTMLEVEATRYENFFSSLDQHGDQRLSRDVAIAFFRKSSLAEPQIAELYALIKTLRLQNDDSSVNKTEFVVGMHFIVCMTKRNLAMLPTTFPRYLFPTLDLQPSSGSPLDQFSSISSMPSPDKDAGFAAFDMAAMAQSVPTMGSMASPVGSSLGFNDTSSTSYTPAGSNQQLEKLQDAQSLRELLQKEIHNKQVQSSTLQQLDQSESNALQSLQACVSHLTESVQQLGFPIPDSAKSLDALDDLSNLLRTQIQATKQEIQSIEISAQMLSIADEASSPTKSVNHLQDIATLTKQLVALQQETTQLYAKRDALAKQALEQKKRQQTTPVVMGSPAASPVAVGSPQQEVRHSESVAEVHNANPFAFDAAPPVEKPSAAAAPASPSGDFGWGAFS